MLALRKDSIRKTVSTGKLENSILLAQKALAQFDREKDILLISNLTGKLANLYKCLGIYKLSKEYFNKALEYSILIGDDDYSSKLYSNTATFYNGIG